jgi:hypothetical protein
MPDYCDIRAVLVHPDKTMRDRLVSSYRRGRVAQEFLPLPAKLLGDGEQQAIQRELHWGTPEDFGEGECSAAPVGSGDRIELEFETVKAPPLGVFIELLRLGFAIEADYWEPGMGFCGYLRDDRFDESRILCWNPKCIRGHLDAALVNRFEIDDGRFHDGAACDHHEPSWSISQGRTLEQYFTDRARLLRGELTIWRALRCDG